VTTQIPSVTRDIPDVTRGTSHVRADASSRRAAPSRLRAFPRALASPATRPAPRPGRVILTRSRLPEPLRVEKLSSRFVDPLVRVRSEVIPLRLEQVRREIR